MAFLFFECLISGLQPDTPIILCGDFNTVLDPRVDRLGCNPACYWAYSSSVSVVNLMTTFELTDIWRKQHPHYIGVYMVSSEWYSSIPFGYVSRISIIPSFHSDNHYVYMEFSLSSTVDLGPRYWKFNTSHLADPSFCEQINSFWLHWRSQKHCYSSIGAWWDAGKIELKKRIRKFSKDQAHHMKTRIKSLQASVFHLNRRLANGEDVEAFLWEAKFELEVYLLKQAKGAEVRSRIHWAEDGERSTSFFCRQEKTRSSRSIVKSISRPNGSFATTSQGILQVFRSYYQDLFTSESFDQHE
ncbi:Hypothetical predicted protein [Paramuricea clavata]|uniref:Uncharacterized protein n=1 Tax=Paramuricea clavata TaxID=317549 RepID=A0A7D9IKL5_PARCT|nr:Hypothetical predicted protein [Paramuricea clavata]